MGFNCGIVGLPNVGKSTLFNALTETQAAEAANYPFCTIDPNIGRVAVPDARLDKLAALAHSAKIIPTQLEFVDIAGLVRGASKGEGLGNQFLGNIRETDAIVHVLRCFIDGDVTHVMGGVDPIRDAEIVETELLLADLEGLEKRQTNLAKKAKGGDKESLALLELVDQALAELNAGRPARNAAQHIAPDQQKLWKSLNLITAKPVLYVANVAENDAKSGNDFSAKVAAKAKSEGSQCVVISANIEAEIATLGTEDKAAFLADLGLSEPGLARVIHAGYHLLGLLTFFTIGPKEAHAWTVTQGSLAPQAAGAIHTDFEKGFIRAETISYQDFVSCGGEAAAKEAGKMRLEGKEYLVQDGDIFHFRFNV
ncbi:MAG: redox-regulated ATPase YchF [Candidatus Symbiobacter sp.]|nr:redox-regulated ATPase YchF [Candidatus Symbiobacter sp.]